METNDRKEQEQEQNIEPISNALTIFDAIPQRARAEAIQALLNGKTPKKYIQQRPGKGGGQVDYANTYYMTRQASLVTGFKWCSECLQEKFRPNEENPIEVGALMKVTLFDSRGEPVSHISWGQKDVARYSRNIVETDKNNKAVKDESGNPIIVHKKGDIISLFDDLKAAYSDGIKKCLSYFGIANDIYGNKDYEAYEEELNDPKKQFSKYVEDKGLTYGTDVFPVLGVKGFSEITDFADALDKLKEKFE